MKKTILAAAAIVAMVSCNKNLIENPMLDSNYGYINLGITADTEMVVTKGISTTATLTGYNIGLFKVNTESNTLTPYWNESTAPGVNVTGGYVDYSVFNDSNSASLWSVPADSYIIKVENMTETEAHGHDVIPGYPHIYGESGNFEVKAGVTSSPVVACTPNNSKVIVSKTTEFDQVFDVKSITVTDGTNKRTIPLSWVSDAAVQTESTTYPAAYMAAGTAVSWSLSVTKKNDTNKTVINFSSESSEQSRITESGKCMNIIFSASTTNGAIDVQITINDQYGNSTTVQETINPLS